MVRPVALLIGAIIVFLNQYSGCLKVYEVPHRAEPEAIRLTSITLCQ